MIRKIKSSFTVDVEDGVSLAMRDVFSVKSRQTSRVVTLTNRILELLGQFNVKGTFFMLGQVAEMFPGLVKDIAEEGHELGVHGYDHLQFHRMTREQAFEELSRAKKLIEDISGREVFGHRAPAFSITPETQWGLDVIAEAGFTYDSSIMPINGIRYGWPGFRKNIHVLETPSGKNLIEAPLSTINILGKEIPVCGGGYLRLFPYWFTKMAFEKIQKERPVVLYLHPYELDTKSYPDYYFEQLKKANPYKRYKMKSMWINRKSVYPKLSNLLKNYEFGKMINLVECATSENTKMLH
ncbi:polysaccharide deacetylase family protein [Aliifodinibius sp. S!AR15-10]|uniref:polysaccharide deacetylase family protein n=1 Tax=Aliifodinibius sp. S!AR15-10 TaxID=2950437 RepID=UPI00285D14AB|nr:polysaccharide deacetylase family protein [Aliifodinibius sp. S!AR15-10]MDR8390262.1 polysaccharide deacetylase family protein [Aliifodinibius sp. S!AR15-10]